MPVIIVIIILVIIAVWVSNLYNNLVRLRNARQNVFADIDVQLRKRQDLVPQLVETVKGYATHEKDLLLKITEARSGAVSATIIHDKIKAEEQLSKVLQGLNVRAEAYPDLKANQNFLQLQEKLNDIENKLATSRPLFNAATTDYNTAVESFPSNLVASNFDFKKEVLFDVATQELRKPIEEPTSSKILSQE